MRYGIVGLGAAGGRALMSLRAHDPEATIFAMGAAATPYELRPSLPELALGRLAVSHMSGFPPGYLTDARMEHVVATAERIDVDRRVVVAGDGSTYGYDRLLLANGAVCQPLSCPGSELDGVVRLSTVADAVRMEQERASGPHRVVIAGSGVVALATAWVARQTGAEVTLLLPHDAFLPPWLDARASQFVYRHLVDDGVHIHMDEEIDAVVGVRGRVTGVRTTAGRHLPCHWVSAPGEQVARTALARTAGLAVTDAATDLAGVTEGVPVNERMETAIPGIFCAGDLSRVWDSVSGCHRAMPGWSAAGYGGWVAGANMAGSERCFEANQFALTGRLYGLPMMLLGRVGDVGDAEVRSAPNADGYRHLVFADGRLIAATLVGDCRHGRVLRRLVQTGLPVAGHELQLLRTDIDLNPLLRPLGEYHLY